MVRSPLRASPRRLRFVSGAWAGLFVALAAGCLEVETEVRFAADGSVVQAVRYAITPGALDSLEQTMLAAPVPGRRAFDPESLFDEAAIGSEIARAGGRLTGFRARSDGAKRVAEIRADFPDHRDFGASPLFGTRSEWFAVKGEGGLVHLIGYPLGRAAWVRARGDAHEASTQVDAVRKQIFESRRNRLEGTKMRFVIEVPGTIKSMSPFDADASARSLKVLARNRVMATFDPAKVRDLPGMILALAPRWEIVFEPNVPLAGWELHDSEPFGR